MCVSLSRVCILCILVSDLWFLWLVFVGGFIDVVLYGTCFGFEFSVDLWVVLFVGGLFLVLVFGFIVVIFIRGIENLYGLGFLGECGLC